MILTPRGYLIVKLSYKLKLGRASDVRLAVRQAFEGEVEVTGPAVHSVREFYFVK